MAMVSVITVTYNCQDSIEQTLKSVLNQTYSDIELIVVDGLSSDGTLDIISKYRDRINKFVSEKDKGIFDAMNKGIQMASGDWIIFMNAGDQFVDKDVLSNLTELLKAPSIGVIYGDWQLKYRNSVRTIKACPFFLQKKCYKTMGFSHQSSLVRTSLAKENPFKIEFKLSADYKMMWHLYHANNILFKGAGFPIAQMEDKAGFTVSNYKKHLIEECNVCEFRDSFYRKIFIETKFFSYKVKRFIKSIILR